MYKRLLKRETLTTATNQQLKKKQSKTANVKTVVRHTDSSGCEEEPGYITLQGPIATLNLQHNIILTPSVPEHFQNRACYNWTPVYIQYLFHTGNAHISAMVWPVTIGILHFRQLSGLSQQISLTPHCCMNTHWTLYDMRETEDNHYGHADKQHYKTRDTRHMETNMFKSIQHNSKKTGWWMNDE